MRCTLLYFEKCFNLYIICSFSFGERSGRVRDKRGRGYKILRTGTGVTHMGLQSNTDRVEIIC
jgi:hypothetical protein